MKSSRHAVVVSYLALFVALGGTAGALAGRNTVDSGDIKPRNVKRSDIATNAVNSAKVAADTLAGADVASNTLQGADIDEPSLDVPQLGQGSFSKPVVWHHFMDTANTGQRFDFGVVEIENVGTAHQFKVCNGSFVIGTDTFTLQILGDTVTTDRFDLMNGACQATATNLGSERAFTVSGESAYVFGTLGFGSGTYHLFGFSAP
jgi:hypothetical protein